MGLTADQQQGLNIQNNGRKQKGLAALQWDAHLAPEAQKWADNLAHKIGHMQHSTSQERPNQGENLFWGMASPGPYKDPYTHAAQAWMNEAAKYHGEKIGEGDFGSYGHYSELCPASFASATLARGKKEADGEKLNSPVHVEIDHPRRHGCCY